MPVRRVSNHGGRNTVGRFPSLKLGRMIDFESTIEWDYVFHLDYASNVVTFEEQPFVIEYKINDKIHRYIPDFHVIEHGHHYVDECKPEKFLDDPDNQRKFSAAAEWCHQRGYQFRVVTDRRLRTGSYLNNVKFLTRFARHHIDVKLRSQILTNMIDLPTDPEITIQDLASRSNSAQPDMALRAIYHLAFHHQLSIPMDDGPIGPISLVKLPTISIQQPLYLEERG